MPSPPSDSSLAVAIEIVPVTEEDDDLDTLAVAEQVRIDMQKDAIQAQQYLLQVVPGNERSGPEILMLIGFVGKFITDNKDLLTSLFEMVSAAINMLARRGHVQEIDVTVNGNRLVLHDVEKRTAKELIEAFVAQNHGVVPQMAPGAAPIVKARVSKKKRAT